MSLQVVPGMLETDVLLYKLEHAIDTKNDITASAILKVLQIRDVECLRNYIIVTDHLSPSYTDYIYGIFPEINDIVSIKELVSLQKI